MKVVFREGDMVRTVRGDLSVEDDFLFVRKDNDTQLLLNFADIIKIESHPPGVIETDAVEVPSIPVPKKNVVTQEVRA